MSIPKKRAKTVAKKTAKKSARNTTLSHEDKIMADVAQLSAKVAELTAAASANADRVAAQQTAFQTALDAAKAAATIPDDLIVQLQAAIDALNTSVAAPAA